jgi:hypothetical protein
MAADVSIIVETNAKEVGNEFTSMADRIVAAENKAKKIARAFEFMDKAMNSGKISGQKYSRITSELDREQTELYASLGKATSAVKAQSAAMSQASAATTRASGTMSQAAVRAQQMAAAQKMAGKSTNRFGLISQQVGYQVGDFFVQVQSGTDALVAFGQQGTQLAGLLPGLAGAILGIGLSLGTAVLNASLSARELRVDFKAVGEDLGQSLGAATIAVDAIKSAFSSLGSVARNVFQSIIDNMDRVVAYLISISVILSSRVAIGFIASGNAARAFFAIIKTGLISTGIGALVVILGEVILQMMRAYKATGNLSEAFSKVWEVAKEVFGRVAEMFWGVVDIAKGAGLLIYEGMKAGLSKIGEAVNTYLVEPVIKGINFIIENLNKLGANFEKLTLPSETTTLLRSRTGAPSASRGQALMAQGMAGITGAIRPIESWQGGDSTSIDPSDWLVSDTDTKGGSKGSKGSIKTFSELLDKLRGETVNQEKLIGLYGERREALEQIMSFEDELKRKLTENEALKVTQAAQEKYRIEERGRLLETMAGHIKGAFMSFVDGSKSVVDAFRDMLRSIILSIYETKVAEPAANAIGSLIDKGIAAIFSANGNVFNQGMHVKAYADGGVVNRTTAFPMRGGVGIMGEAGPEAIMPLKRGKNGKLGVQMEGSGGGAVTIHQSFNFSANGDESVKRIIRGEVPRITEATKAAVLDAKRRGGSYGRAF